MDFETIQIPYGRADEHITVYMHPTMESRTLVFLVHSHNSMADQPRYTAFANALQHAGINVCRFQVLREQVGDYAKLVTTIEEEVRQASVVIEAMREEFEVIIAAGHSQGGIVALQLALDHHLDGVMLLMSVYDPQRSADHKLQLLGVDLDELRRRKTATIDLPDGRVMTYTPAVIEDMQLQDMHGMLTQLHAPILAVQASHDEFISAEETEHGISMMNEPTEVLTVDDKHRFSAETAERIAEKAIQWIDVHGLRSKEDDAHFY